MTKPPGQKKKRVAVALSGGVDSAVAAAILKNRGFDCLGIFMKFWHEAETGRENKCCSAQAAADARRIAQKLGLPFYVLNFCQPFKKTVVDRFLKSYQGGQTPNPCVECNHSIKFDLLLKKAKMLGCDYLTTGHYIKISNLKSQISKQIYKLFQAKDKTKDQSYFLYTLKQSQLKHLLFPLGDYTKTQVRKMAQKYGLPVYHKPDSQEICFVPEKTHYDFLKRHLKLKSGAIKDQTGKIIGRHEGLPLYTLGQRKGIKIGGTGPFYVVKLDPKTNTLYVSNKPDDKRLLTTKFRIKDINWISGRKPLPGQKVGVKIRYQAKTIPAKIKGHTVYLVKPQRAIMPGQSAVFYCGQEVLGGGVIKG